MTVKAVKLCRAIHTMRRYAMEGSHVFLCWRLTDPLCSSEIQIADRQEISKCVCRPSTIMVVKIPHCELRANIQQVLIIGTASEGTQPSNWARNYVVNDWAFLSDSSGSVICTGTRDKLVLSWATGFRLTYGFYPSKVDPAERFVSDIDWHRWYFWWISRLCLSIPKYHHEVPNPPGSRPECANSSIQPWREATGSCTVVIWQTTLRTF